MIKIPSLNPPGSEAPLAEFIVNWSRKNGLNGELQEVSPGRPNALITLEGGKTGPTLLFTGHMDVMPVGNGWTFDPFGAEISDGLMYGRGACDMKAGLTSMLVAAKSLANSGRRLRGKLIVGCVADEEGPGTGTQQMLKEGLTADYAIVGEPSSLRVITASKGDVVFELNVRGKAAHSSVPEEGINAINKMRPVMEGVDEYSREVKAKSHSVVGSPTVSIDMIEGGTSPWVIPEFCRVVVDRRMIPGETFEEVKNEVSALVARLNAQDKELKLEASYIQMDEPVEISREEKIVQSLVESAAPVLGKPPEVGGIAGTTDARFLVNKAKIPTVIFGPGNLAQAHKPDEFVSVNETLLAARIYADLAGKLLF